MLSDFINARVRMWRRLEELIGFAERERLVRLERGEVRELARLYRRTAADLAIAREEARDPILVRYLNALVARAHGAIYRNEGSGFAALLDMFRYEIPSVFRRTFRFTLGAFLLTLFFASLGAIVTMIDERFADAVVYGLRDKIERHENWTLAINEANPIEAAVIQQNNIMVSITAFAGGALAGLGTFYILMFNGLMLGVVISLCLRYDFQEILVFIAGHGVLELTAIFVAGGAGFLLASALVSPGDVSRVDALIERGRLAIVLMIFCATLLVIAGLIEGFISPALIHPGWKLGVSATTGLLLALYVLKPDRRPGAATTDQENTRLRSVRHRG